MKVFYSNINKMNEDIESFVIAKNKIEKILIEEEKIEAKQSIKDFLNMVEINKVFVSSKTPTMATIAFTMYKNENDDEMTILYSSTNEIAEKEFKEIIKYIKYNLNNLVSYTEYDIEKLNNNPYFIMDNKFYMIK